MSVIWSGTITDRHVKVLVLTIILIIPFFILGLVVSLSMVHLGYYSSEYLFGDYEDKMNDHLGLGLFWDFIEIVVYLTGGLVALGPPLIISLLVFKKDK